MKTPLPRFLISYCLLLFILPGSVSGQHLVSWQFLRTLNSQQIDSMHAAFGIPVGAFAKRYDVITYKFIYNTVSYDSSATTASALLALPVNPTCPMSVFTYCHSTETQKNNAPSYMGGEFPVGVTMAADGMAGVVPDYLGLGDSPLPLHPYLHANSEATATIDAMRAARELVDSLGLQLNGQVFLAGYSQGGHSCMATQKMIEEKGLLSEFNITGSLPMSGPYDLAGVQANVITQNVAYASPLYLPYIIFSYNTVYNIWSSYSQVMISPYDTTLYPFFTGNFPFAFVNSLLPSVPNAIMQPLVLDSFRTDTAHYLWNYLQQNTLLNWAPVSPTKLLYCSSDDQVSPLNTMNAYNSFVQNGSSSVQYKNVGSIFTHYQCALFAFVNAKAWVDSLRTDLILATYQVSNPSSPGAQDGEISVTVSGGIPPYTIAWSNGASGPVASNLPAGTYIVTISDSINCSRTDTVELQPAAGLYTLSDGTGIGFYPNPAGDVLNIYRNGIGQEDVELKIFDAQGRLSGDYNIENRLQIDCSAWSPGVYIMRFFSGNKILTAKLVVQ